MLLRIQERPKAEPPVVVRDFDYWRGWNDRLQTPLSRSSCSMSGSTVHSVLHALIQCSDQQILFVKEAQQPAWRIRGVYRS